MQLIRLKAYANTQKKGHWFEYLPRDLLSRSKKYSPYISRKVDGLARPFRSFADASCGQSSLRQVRPTNNMATAAASAAEKETAWGGVKETGVSAVSGREGDANRLSTTNMAASVKIGMKRISACLSSGAFSFSSSRLLYTWGAIHWGKSFIKTAFIKI